MKTNVSGLLRDFPKVRRAALSGERVVIETREGNLLLVAENPPSRELHGCLRNEVISSDDDIDGPTLPTSEWDASL